MKIAWFFHQSSPASFPYIYSYIGSILFLRNIRNSMSIFQLIFTAINQTALSRFFLNNLKAW